LTAQVYPGLNLRATLCKARQATVQSGKETHRTRVIELWANFEGPVESKMDNIVGAIKMQRERPRRKMLESHVVCRLPVWSGGAQSPGGLFKERGDSRRKKKT